MLCQLVCTDRRYQRMNCFNIRELQGILKRRFFTDLVNSNDHRDLLNSSMIGLRFKANSTLSLDNDMLSFYNYGTTLTSKSKELGLVNSYANSNVFEYFNSFTSLNIYTSYITTIVSNVVYNLFTESSLFSTFTRNSNPSNSYINLLKDFTLSLIDTLQNFSFVSLTTLYSITSNVSNVLLTNFNINL